MWLLHFLLLGHEHTVYYFTTTSMNRSSKLSPFFLFLLSMVFFVLLRFTDSDNTIGIIKLLFYFHRLLFRLLTHFKDVVCLLTQDVLCLLTQDVRCLFTQDVMILRNWHSCQWLKCGFEISWLAHENTKQCCCPFFESTLFSYLCCRYYYLNVSAHTC